MKSKRNSSGHDFIHECFTMRFFPDCDPAAHGIDRDATTFQTADPTSYKPQAS